MIYTSTDANRSFGQTDKLQIELLGNFPYEWLFLMGNPAFCRKNENHSQWEDHTVMSSFNCIDLNVVDLESVQFFRR